MKMSTVQFRIDAGKRQLRRGPASSGNDFIEARIGAAEINRLGAPIDQQKSDLTPKAPGLIRLNSIRPLADVAADCEFACGPGPCPQIVEVQSPIAIPMLPQGEQRFAGLRNRNGRLNRKQIEQRFIQRGDRIRMLESRLECGFVGRA